ncbi:MAG: 2,3-diphosphoglycerate-dependent phosphoglycerate mutase [archaeon]
MIKLVLLRHGESIWNKQNKFTGWTDVGLSKKGVEEAKKAGKILRQKGFIFDIAFTSVLKRATKTLDIVLKEMHQKVPVSYTWRLNERHYGALQGLNKAQTARKYGEDQVHIWRRSYSVRPPALSKRDIRSPAKDAKYKGVTRLPLTECLKDTYKRVMPYWKKEIVPLLKKKKRIIISAHGNSLRSLVKYLDKISDKDISNLNIPTGIPLVYEFDNNLKVAKHYYLGNKKELAAAVKKVKDQIKN